MKLEVQKYSKKLLNSAAYEFKPILAEYFGSPLAAIVYNQLLYRGKTSKYKTNSETTVVFSYRQMAAMFSCTRKWIIEVIKNLQAKGVVEVISTGRKNKILIKELSFQSVDVRKNASMMVFPELLTSIGLIQAIVLQQVHIRQHKTGKQVKKSLTDWHNEVFMFMSLSTVKRVFKKLEELGLLKKTITDDDLVRISAYAIDYEKLEIFLGLKSSVAALGKPVSQLGYGKKSW